jgi:hypothetical protein
MAAIMHRRTVRRVVALVLGASLGLAISTFVTIGSSEEPIAERPIHYIQADLAYDVSDPTLVAGDAVLVVIATVEAPVRVDEHRTVFMVNVLDVLEGVAPSVMLVSQLGSDTSEGGIQQLEGFPLMSPGTTYVMALVAPSIDEPWDAMVVLSAADDGNLVEVTGLDDLAVTQYQEAVAQQVSPWDEEDGVEEARAEDYARWLEANGL